MAMATFKCEFPRRQAMLELYDRSYDFEKKRGFMVPTGIRVPVFVWPMPTSEGLFVVEHQDGTVQRVQPEHLTFLNSKELFDQYDWSCE